MYTLFIERKNIASSNKVALSLDSEDLEESLPKTESNDTTFKKRSLKKKPIRSRLSFDQE